MADVKKLPKPQLRGLLTQSFRRHAFVGAAFCTTTVLLFKVFVCDARKQRYADYYKNYDLEADVERMRKLGLLQSMKP
ncbi:hypothetical protein CHUAL_005631 [Chamberlinius hualienensis]